MKDDRLYLIHIQEAIGRIEKYTDKRSGVGRYQIKVEDPEKIQLQQ